MPKTFQTPFWRTVLPDGWQARRSCGDGEFVTLWHPEGVGQLRILLEAEMPALSRNHEGQVCGLSTSAFENRREKRSIVVMREFEGRAVSGRVKVYHLGSG
jgi:hypothetical protein